MSSWICALTLSIGDTFLNVNDDTWAHFANVFSIVSLTSGAEILGEEFITDHVRFFLSHFFPIRMSRILITVQRQIITYNTNNNYSLRYGSCSTLINLEPLRNWWDLNPVLSATNQAIKSCDTLKPSLKQQKSFLSAWNKSGSFCSDTRTKLDRYMQTDILLHIII